MREVDKRMPDWNMARSYPSPGESWTPAHTELAHWHRDQRANDRGYRIDLGRMAGCASVYTALFATGHALLGNWNLALVLTLSCVVSTILLVRSLRRALH
jgi:hypothetical protein